MSWYLDWTERSNTSHNIWLIMGLIYVDRQIKVKHNVSIWNY